MLRARRVFSRRPRGYGRRSVRYQGRDTNYVSPSGDLQEERGGGDYVPGDVDGNRVDSAGGYHSQAEGDPRFSDGECANQRLPGSPLIVRREDHCISRKNIDPDALKILYRLSRFGYQAFLVGGGVRDLLLGKKPKDYDISTSATPREVKSVFRNSRLIGRRFRIVHVFFQNNKIIEVSTLRATSSIEESAEDTAVVKEDNTYGDAESDALRRDITINGLFYDPVSYSVIDYVGGLDDLKAKTVRVIGEPSIRFKEDPVRMIRAVRHAARADFDICPETYQAICDSKGLIALCSKPRVYEELLREFRGTAAERSVEILFKTGLLEYLLPALNEALVRDGERVWPRLKGILSRFDDLAKSKVELPPSLIFLALTIWNYGPGGNLRGMLHEQYSAVSRESEETIWAAVPNLTGYGDLLKDPASADSGLSEEVVPSAVPSQERREGRGRRRWRRSKAHEDTESEDDRVLRHGIPSVNEVTKAVHQIFTPIGVSRREQERMVRMLLGRYELFVLWKQATEQSESRLVVDKGLAERGNAVNDFLRRAHFNDSLQLLELTGLESEAVSCSDFWLERLNKYYQKKRNR